MPFNLFSRKRHKIPASRRCPSRYDGLVTQAEYEQILDIALREVARYGTIDEVDDGLIALTTSDADFQNVKFSLDNLVRKCKSATPAEWDVIIVQHFERFVMNKSKDKYIYKDFEYAQNLLKVQVRPLSMFDSASLDDYIHRADIPTTATFLILDYDDLFHYVRKEQIGEWERSIDELFEVAFANIAQEDYKIERGEMADGIPIFCVLSGDFSASYVVELQQNMPFAVGQYGAIVSIPSKGTALVHALESNSALAYIDRAAALQQNFYTQDPVPISPYFYWYYAGNFQMFQVTKKEDSYFLSFPPALLLLLAQSSS